MKSRRGSPRCAPSAASTTSSDLAAAREVRARHQHLHQRVRDAIAEAALLRFLERALPFTYLSAVVMQELAAGARTGAQRHELERSVFGPFVRRGRVFTPSALAFVNSGRVIAGLAAREGWSGVRLNPSLLNDALLATSCREQGIVLVTRDSDFSRFGSLLKGWRAVAPWPALP